MDRPWYRVPILEAAEAVLVPEGVLADPYPPPRVPIPLPMPVGVLAALLLLLLLKS
jgi:hypothetical protein